MNAFLLHSSSQHRSIFNLHLFLASPLTSYLRWSRATLHILCQHSPSLATNALIEVVSTQRNHLNSFFPLVTSKIPYLGRVFYIEASGFREDLLDQKTWCHLFGTPTNISSPLRISFKLYFASLACCNLPASASPLPSSSVL
jgi:hypothetical protein